MISIKLKGGLGNQMFQYATLKALSLIHKKKIYIDLESIKKAQLTTDLFTPRKFSLNVFGIEATPLPILFRFALKISVVLKKILTSDINLFYNSYNDDSDLSIIKFPAYLDGYFQSENYFKEFRQQILAEFSFKFALDKANERLLCDLNKNESISIHFRRADYVDKPEVSLFHGVCSLDYYRTAIEYLKEKIHSPVFYVFTDDPIWVQTYFIDSNPLYRMVLVNINHGVDSWKDMYLMSKCRYNIIANSSFSWWGAWLNTNPDKIVIAPSQWYADPKVNAKSHNIVPSSWIKI